jgi:hypothetical protein
MKLNVGDIEEKVQIWIIVPNQMGKVTVKMRRVGKLGPSRYLGKYKNKVPSDRSSRELRPDLVRNNASLEKPLPLFLGNKTVASDISGPSPISAAAKPMRSLIALKAPREITPSSSNRKLNNEWINGSKIVGSLFPSS